MKRSESIENKAIPAAFFALLVLIWLAVVESGAVPKFVLPSPRDVVITFFKILPDLKVHILTTLKEAFIGLAIAIFLSLVLAVVMDSIELLRKAIYPLLIISQTIPTIALAPLFVIWFGFGQLPKVIVVVLVCFFPIVVSLLDGLSSVDIGMENMLKSMGASKAKIFYLLKFPASMVNFFSGLRIAATYSIMGAVIGEWLGGEGGLGVYMLRVKHSFALDKMFAVILLIVILSMALFKTISLIQDFTMPWHSLQNKNVGRN
jgi:ABC-type nitrate/sulfonate/bicarbonate transport system permease component